MSNIQNLIVLDKTEIEKRIAQFKLGNNHFDGEIEELENLLYLSKPLEPIVCEAFRQGSNVPSFEDDSIAESNERYKQLKQHYLKTFKL